MATSGQVTTNTAFGYVKLAWSLSSQNIENNTSTVAYTLSIYRSSNISSSAAKSYSINFNGAAVASGTTTIGGSGTKTIKTGTTVIPHNADGTKTFAFSFSQQIDITWSGSWIGTISGSGSGTLTTIPRATTPAISPSSVDMGSAFTVTLNRASTAFTHKLFYSFGSLSNQTGGISNATSATTSATFTPPLTLANQIPNATSGTGVLTCETWNGTTKIGTKTISFVVKVPSSVVPTISNVAITEAVTSPDIATIFSNFVQHKSKARVVTTAAGAYSSTILTYQITVRDANDANLPLLASYSGADITTDLLTWPTTTIRIGIAVTDSRGRSASVFYNKTVLAYTPPQITSYTAFRADDSGNPDYESQKVKVFLNFSIATVGNLNAKYYEVVYKVKGASSWAGSLASGNVYSRNDSFISGAVFSTDQQYEIHLRLWDTFVDAANGIYAVADIPTAFTLFDCRSTGKGIAFGKVSEKDAMEIALPVEIPDGITQEDRQVPTLLNSWVNYGSSYESATYWKDSCGVVHLAGLIKSGATAAETVIFTLPTGYRPRTSEKFFCVSLNAICVIDVYSTGNIAIKTGANSGWLSLSGINFRAN